MEREIKPGDIIWANRIVKGLPYNHCGIYIGDGRVIHFAAPAGSEISMENAVIHETTVEQFQDDCPLKIIEIPEKYCFSDEETIERARSRIGQKGYDFLTNNCDHFAMWCKTGNHRSLQTETVKNTIRATGNDIGEIICNIHDAAESIMAYRNKTRGDNIAKKVDIEMCQQAVSILANMGSSAESLIRQAVNACELNIYQGGFKPREAKGNRPAWITLAKDNGWIIEQNKIFKQIRLLSPAGKREVSINLEHKIQEFFTKLIKIGKEEIKINDCFSNMALDKDGEFIVLVGRMGAKHIDSISIDNKNTDFIFNGASNNGGNSPVGSFSVGAGAHFKGDLKNFKKYEVHFEDNQAKFTDDLLKKSRWFKNDPEMNSLFTTVKERRIKSWKYKSSLSESSDIDFSVEAQNIGIDEAELKSAFAKRKGFYREFTVEF